MSPVTFDMIVAYDRERGIGRDGNLPWRLAADMAYFKRVTQAVSEPSKRNAVVMGRKTWLSIPPRFRPLAKRLNVVLTRQEGFDCGEGVLVASSLEEGLRRAAAPDIETVFLIGGGAVYEAGMSLDGLRRVYATEIDDVFDCDTFFPSLAPTLRVSSRSEPQRDGGYGFRFVVYSSALTE